ncbi:MAG: 4-alpha-glucanotransferase [Nitrospirae bacterium]|nr:4-alpha-glucanotransferase [Nitrospirota bacterium]
MAKFGDITRFLTGVAIPVFSLRTEDNCGVGEFYDLIKLGQWCKKTGLDIIQILPVNDTGGDSSPYSAQSAFALNPLYMRLTEIEGMNEFSKEIDNGRILYDPEVRLNYLEMYKFKVSILKKCFESNKAAIIKDIKLKSWIKENSWLTNYCVFCTIKEAHNQSWWQDWTILKDPTQKEINKYWTDNSEEVMFHAWMQYHLEKQLIHVSKELTEMDIKLKGDIPILINEDSADVWGHRDYFDLDVRAGAPPDMFSKLGQNWGFPCYNWEKLEGDDYLWWRQRLRQASKFYHACRIDHVLGFFRIWSCPKTEHTGALGYFNPAVHIKEEDIIKAGFSKKTIETLIEPRFHKNYLKELFGVEAERFKGLYFSPLPDDVDTYVFSDLIDGEKSITALEESDEIKNTMLELHRNRVLIPVGSTGKEYLPKWFFDETNTFRYFSDDEKNRLRSVIDINWSPLQEDLWWRNGHNLLKMMSETVDMLVCAEDLGAVPKCVPGVLFELKILGLKIERWEKDYKKEGHPFMNPNNFPRLSVNSPSCHDTSTLRGWWEEGGWNRNQYFSTLGLSGGCPDFLTTSISKAIIERNLNANSLICIFALQDLLSLYYNLRVDSASDERVNTPGTPSSENWSYRMKDTLEFLIEYDEFNNYLKGMIDKRHRRKL